MTMRYSGSGERVEAVAGSIARRFAYDENQRTLGEYGTSAADVKAEHIWLMPDLEEDGYEPLAIAGPTTITYVHGDHLGAPALLTNATGAVANRYDALPFGQRWASLAASPTTGLAFPGQLIDAVDRHYNLHRDYDSTLGRYLQADPIGLAGGDNPYAYAEGNPLSYIDPDGKNPLLAMGLIGAAIYGGWDFYQQMQAGCGINGWQTASAAVNGALIGVTLAEAAPLYLALRAASGAAVGARVGAEAAARATTAASKIEGQLLKRGWSRSSVDDAISNPTRTVPTRDTRHLPGGARNNDPATAYYSRDGGYVVRNDRTGDVVQVSNRNDLNWRAPWD